MNSEKFSAASLFGTDGIRGTYGNPPLTVRSMEILGEALGEFFHPLSSKKGVVLAWDSRESSFPLAFHLASSLKKQGFQCFLQGVFPTAAVSYWVVKKNALFGCMITASHNPYPDNGIKIMDALGQKLTFSTIEKLASIFARRLNAASFSHLCESFPLEFSPSFHGTNLEARKDYLNFIQDKGGDLSGLKIALDMANGALSSLAPEAFKACGARLVSCLGNQPDGKNINKNVGSLFPERLQSVVLEKKADIGFAFDGDGDRIVAINASGEICDGDQILALFSKIISEGGIVGTDISNRALEKFFIDQGRKFLRSAVGDTHIAEKLNQQGWILGGESSGHILVSHFSPTSDALLNAMLISRYLKNYGNPFPLFQPMPCLMLSFPLKDPALLQDLEVQKQIEFWKEEFSKEGLWHLRPSGTEPLLRLCVQHPDADFLHRHAEIWKKFFTHDSIMVP